MHAAGKSDRSVVPMKRPNKPGAAVAKAAGSGGAEDVEGRGLAQLRLARTLDRRPRSGLRAGMACRADWRACAKRHVGIDVRGSPLCCTMSRRSCSRTASCRSSDRRRPRGPGWGGRSDVDAVRGWTWGPHRGPPFASSKWGATRGLPRSPLAQDLHPLGEGGADGRMRPLGIAAPVLKLGGQDRAGGGGEGAGVDLRGGLPRLLLRIPPGTQPA
jgi:hypothetical protein